MVPDHAERTHEAGSRDSAERPDGAETVTGVRSINGPDAAAAAQAVDAESGEREDESKTVATRRRAAGTDGGAKVRKPVKEPAGKAHADPGGDRADSPGDTGTAAAPARKGAPELPVRAPRSRRVGRRRAVGPVIGDQLAVELLGDHRADVLLADRCSCGDAFPCRSRAFATCFVRDEAYPPADLEMPYQIVPPQVRAEAGPRHADRTAPPRRSSGGQSVRSGSGSGSVVASPLPIDLDATVQFEKVPAEPPPVAVAV